MGCTIGGIYYGTIFYTDDIVLLGTSTSKIQKIIDICFKYGNKYGIKLNRAKTNWMYTIVCNNVSFNINGYVIQNVGSSIKYLGVDLFMNNNMLTIDVDNRIIKFNVSAYDIL